MSLVTLEKLFREILAARERVYVVGEVTPLEPLHLPGTGAEVWVKREDLGPAKSFKWRGAYNALAVLSEEDRARGVVTASAGNHAQGVAIGAAALGCRAVIFMPRSTPELKQREVQRFGGDAVEVMLVGNTYDDASEAAKDFCESNQSIYIHPYDDLMTMAGQGTLADEVVMSGKGPFDRVYLAIGGGGLAAAVACWLKRYWPEVKIYGVEGVAQASMLAAVNEGEPVGLDYVDVFCDGTAVRKVGEKTFEICNELLDGVLTVNNDEVCHAIRSMWECLRVIPEPSGAMSLAGFLQHDKAGDIPQGEKVLTVVCGANMDFAQLGSIAVRAGVGSKQRRFLRVPVPEGKGMLVNFLSELPEAVNIIDLQYGRVGADTMYPVLGLIASEEDYAALDQVIQGRGVEAIDVSKDEDVRYRVINYAAELFENPLFVNIEFPERAGAFLEFMKRVKDIASLCYFNYAYSGERVGRALVGMEFTSVKDRAVCLKRIDMMKGGCIRAAREVSDETFYRLTGKRR